jgi:PAS domain S-box-containing protein
MTSDGLRTIVDLNAKLRNVTKSEDAFMLIADEVRALTKADYASLILIDEGKNKLVIMGVAGAPASQVRTLPQIDVDRELRERLFRTKVPVTVRYDSYSSLPGIAKPLADALSIETALLCTMILRGEVLGYVVAASRKTSPPISPEAESGLKSVSEYLAVVVENVRASSELRIAKEEADRLLELAPIGIFACDPKGIFLSVNNQMLAMLDKKSEDDLVGTSVFEVPAIIRSGLDALIVQGMEGHAGEKADVHVVPRTDKAFYVHAKATPVRSVDGEIESVLFVAMDVTSKVRLQNQLERSYEKLTQTFQELERVTKMKTQFIDIVSHELRTPLTVMRGYIDLLQSEYSSQMEPKFASRLGIIKSNTDRLYSLVESMLDVSRLETGSLQIHKEPVKIDTILENVVNSRMKEAEEKKQSLALEIEGSIPLVMADRRRIKDVFNNIIDNALKYTQESGRIQVGVRDEGRMLHAWVKDNGVGIPLENLGSLFDRFHIVTSNDLSHQVDRLGLGLPISKGIIEAHGGKMWVESQVGKGSVFHVEIPKESPK